MAWGRSRKAPKEKGLPATVSNDVRSLMCNRHAVLAPFKVNPEMLYRTLWSDIEWRALETLSTKAILRTDDSVLVIDVEVGGTFRTVKVKLPGRRPMGMLSVSSEVKPADLEPAVMEEITLWANNWARLWMETERVVEKVEKVQKVCKTYGQLLRIWPDLRGFLPEHVRKNVDYAKSRSKYPEHARDFNYALRGTPDHGAIKKEFRPEAFEPYTVMLAEALMLPEATDFGIASVEGLSFRVE